MRDYFPVRASIECPDTRTRQPLEVDYEPRTGLLSLRKPPIAGTDVFIDYVSVYQSEPPHPNAPRVSKFRGGTKPARNARAKRASRIKAAKSARKQGRH